MKLKEWTNKYNPFNSMKVLCFRDRFEDIMNGNIPQPASVSVDSTNTCNLNCKFCHYAEFREEQKKTISEKDLLWLADAIPKLGVRSCCYAGGGEPLLHSSSGKFLRKLSNNEVDIGIITNGLLIDRYIEDIIESCKWVGVSVDSATEDTYINMKGATNGQFDKVKSNIMELANYNKLKVGFKFLVHPDNYFELYSAAQLARDLGCSYFHARPCFNPELKWDDDMINYTLKQVKEAQAHIETNKFQVCGVTHKFDNKFHKKVIEKCEITPIAGTTFAADGWVYLCCDLRGEKQGKLCKWREIFDVWGSEHHREVIDNIDPNKCPHRCTYAPYQEILDEVFRKDLMTWKFV